MVAPMNDAMMVDDWLCWSLVELDGTDKGEVEEEGERVRNGMRSRQPEGRIWQEERRERRGSGEMRASNSGVSAA